MRKVKLVGADRPEKWGWNKNPENDKVYNLDDIPKMYGSGFKSVFGDVDGFLSNWTDRDWDNSHGKWEEL